MKRLLFILLLLPSLAWGSDLGQDYARMNPYILGGGASAAGCSQTIIRQLNGGEGAQWGLSGREYIGVNYTTTVSSPIKSISVPLYIAVGSPAGTITASICTDSSTNPGTCTSIGTLDSSIIKAVDSGYGVVFYNFYDATGAAQDGSSPYWVVLNDASADAENNQRWSYTTSGTQHIERDADGAGTWTEVDTSADAVYQLGTCAYGAAETPVQGYGVVGGAYALGHATRYKMGIGMKALSAYTPVKVAVNLAKVLAPPGNLTVEIYASGGNVPTGSNICSGSTSYAPAQIGTSAAWYDFTLTGCPELTADTEYFFVVSSDALGDSSNYYIPGNTTTSGLALDFVGYTTGWSNISTDGGMGLVVFK